MNKVKCMEISNELSILSKVLLEQDISIDTMWTATRPLKGLALPQRLEKARQILEILDKAKSEEEIVQMSANLNN